MGATGEFSKILALNASIVYVYDDCSRGRKGIELTRERLQSFGKDIKFYDGVRTWFKRINDYGESKGVKVEHYLISSGNKEIVEGCAIAKEFKEIYGCEFLFDDKTKLPVWPKLAINYTAKTQFFFRISKGILDVTDDASVNRKQSDRRIPYRNIVYLGDG